MATGFPTKANWAAGDVLTASAMDDLAGTVNLVSAPLYNAAGKNKIINGDFGIWQRGTTLTLASAQGYISDRWYCTSPGADSVVYSRQSLTAGAAPVAGYNGSYAMQMSWSSTLVSYPGLVQRVEDVRTFAGQTVTLSFWAKSTSNVTINSSINQNFGSGGSSTVNSAVTSFSVTSSWQRFSLSLTLASISGQTIGTNSYLEVTPAYFTPTTTANTVQFWGVQLEAGSYGTGFQTATGTLQGELAACRRYFQNTIRNGTVTVGQANGTSSVFACFMFDTVMRTTPTIVLPTVGSSTNQATFLTAAAGFPTTTGTIVAQAITNYGYELYGSGYTAAFTPGNASMFYANGLTSFQASAEL